jgi:ABC-2 type transport system ATP-binding protein
VTPIAIRLDGKRHTVSRPLEAIAHTLRPGSSVTLQLTSSATNYGIQRAVGLVDFKRIELRLPTIKPGKSRR